MNFQETIAYLFARLPMFQRVGASAYRPGLENILALCDYLGNPQQKYPTLHIAGTNGKGSTSHTLAAILQSAGYKTGLYTSPHLKSFTERIKINGADIPENQVISFVQRIQPKIDELQPSFFEITVAMAFDYFAQAEVDIAVIEVGMGGRLDSTNIIKPLVSVITNISFDHMEFLGDTLPKIAGEKAGIIKPDTPVVVSEYQTETAPVFRHQAQRNQAPIYFAHENYTIKYTDEGSFLLDIYRAGQIWFKELNPSLKGSYQLKNLLGVLQTIEILQKIGWQISTQSIQTGIEQAAELTGLKGRWQIIAQNPLTVCDTAHNEGGIREVVAQIAHTPHQVLHLILGFTKEKDLAKILPLYPTGAKFYFCQFNLPRSLSAEALQQFALTLGFKSEVFANVNLALQKARSEARAEDMILVGGSTFVVAEVQEI
ncbi:MAG: bifunctional folylpolyglutamate synthase/dihydrofolate synthase [Microscillaceae bacterium]|jgi:dihydrofolate synthase/folylpolyglutamate synthase|nr:bifunctional folylpolyglutamate synthase/dihydrofolate synthase [Microscillaceae bacterium]